MINGGAWRSIAVDENWRGNGSGGRRSMVTSYSSDSWRSVVVVNDQQSPVCGGDDGWRSVVLVLVAMIAMLIQDKE